MTRDKINYWSSTFSEVEKVLRLFDVCALKGEQYAPLRESYNIPDDREVCDAACAAFEEVKGNIGKMKKDEKISYVRTIWLTYKTHYAHLCEYCQALNVVYPCFIEEGSYMLAARLYCNLLVILFSRLLGMLEGEESDVSVDGSLNCASWFQVYQDRKRAITCGCVADSIELKNTRKAPSTFGFKPSAILKHSDVDFYKGIDEPLEQMNKLMDELISYDVFMDGSSPKALGYLLFGANTRSMRLKGEKLVSKNITKVACFIHELCERYEQSDCFAIASNSIDVTSKVLKSSYHKYIEKHPNGDGGIHQIINEHFR